VGGRPSATCFGILTTTTRLVSNRITKARHRACFVTNTCNTPHPDRVDKPICFQCIPLVSWKKAEYRQPMMRARAHVKRIDGTSGIVGSTRCLDARVNEDVAVGRFRSAVIALIADCRAAYWDFNRVYRVTRSVAKGREAGCRTFQYHRSRLEVGYGTSRRRGQPGRDNPFEARFNSASPDKPGVFVEVEQTTAILIGMQRVTDQS